MDTLYVALASLLAGFVDAIVGGGGLVLVPALFAAFPSTHPATLFGTNKAAAVWGTAAAAAQYTRRVQLRWRTLVPGIVLAGLGAMGGAWTVTVVSPDLLRRALPLVLSLVLVYTLLRKDMGREHRPTLNPRGEVVAGALMGLTIGFYDGFFGPGTGSFFVFLMVRWLGYDFLHASASAKVLNTTTNLAALSMFAWGGHIWWKQAAILAVANVVGSLLGTRMALRHGAGFVRVVFMLVVASLIVKTGWDAYRL